MEKARRTIIGWVLILIAIAVSVQFAVQTLYDAAGDVWFWIDIAMLLAVLFSLGASFAAKRVFDSNPDNDGAFNRAYFETNVRFYASLALALLFAYNWLNFIVNGFEEAATYDDYSIVWTVIDILVVALSYSLGRALLKSAREL